MQTGIYRHYKGGFYQIIGVAQHSENHEKLVVYVSLDATQPGPRLRVRPLTGPEGFETPVVSLHTGGIERPRFVYIGDEL